MTKVASFALGGCIVVATVMYMGAPAVAARAHCGVVKAQAFGSGPGAGSVLGPMRRKLAYNAAFAKARSAAITNWQSIVVSKCTGDSRLWVRANVKSVAECDRAMGGKFTVCVSARPGRRYFD